MITTKSLDRLAGRVADSRHRLVDLVEQRAIRINGAVAWGQFLDAPRKAGQFGIYATSAAIQMLVGAGHTANSPLVSRALLWLPELNARDPSEVLHDSTDMSITFKEAAILEAAQPGQEHFTDEEPIEKALIGQVIDGHGWGNYFDVNDQDDLPRLLPTAHVLMALRRSRHFRGTTRCETVLRWFCETATGDGPLPIHEAALGLLVLLEYASPGVAIPFYQAARDHLLAQVVNWTKSRNNASFGEGASYHYWAVSQGTQQNHYLFYPPDLMAVVALLRAGSPRATRQSVLDIVELLCTSISHNGGFPSTASRRIATVDQLWAYSALREFGRVLDADRGALLTPPAYLLSATPVRRIAASLTLVVIGAAGTLLTLLGRLPVAVRVGGGVLATVCLGMVASLLFVWIRGD